MNDNLQKGITNDRLIRWLSPDSSNYTKSMGCPQCPQHKICGGLHIEGGLTDCHDLCCEDFASCTLVCKRRSESDYVNQVREIGGFELEGIPVSPSIPIDLPTGAYPFIRHKYCRSELLAIDLVAISLSDLITFQTSSLKYSTEKELRAAFHLAPETRIIVTGVDPDSKIEQWWRLSEQQRIPIIQGMRRLGIELVTTPNYSVVLDSPRMNDFHSFKRIALTCSEFMQAGIACALHSHGRTNYDFVRWGRYLRDHPEISMLAYEFTTGPGRSDRLDFHVEQLKQVQRIAGRPLSIVVRGNLKCIPGLQESFKTVTYLESNSFMKAVKRQEAYISNKKMLKWRSSETEKGEPIDQLLHHNICKVKAHIEDDYFKSRPSPGRAA